MPSKDLIKANGLTETMFPPHLRKKLGGGGGNSVIQNVANDTALKMICGETIPLTYVIGIGADGKAYKASNVTANALPCVAIALESGVLNGVIAVGANGYNQPIHVEGVTFTPGGMVYLTDGAPNLNTRLSSWASGTLIQKIGTAISADEFIISIEEPIRIL